MLKRKHNNRKNNKPNPKHYLKRVNNARNNEVTYRLPRSRNIVPDSLVTNLTYIDQTNNAVKNAATNVGSVRYRPSGAQDVDPNLFSTAIPGFKELTALYGKYRVLSSSIRVTFTNLEASPVHVYVWPSNFDLGANYGFAAASIASPFAKSVTVSRAGGVDTAIISRKLTTSQIFGTDEVLYDDDFSASISTIPNNNWFWNVGAWAPSLVTLTSGVQTLTQINIVVQFTERIIITN